MHDIRTRLEQGGITLEAADNSFPLAAATYTHPVLAGRPVVRLTPEPLVEADKATLAVTGLELEGHTPVGHVRRRAVGFPEWPILHDPDNAHVALDLVADLKRLSTRAASKPGAAKKELDALADTLDASAPHFVPTFLEEAGRIFLEIGNTSYASQMFTKAREVERRHALPIDEERHREVMMEFAYAGAISTKELTAEATSLTERLEPADAYDRFRSLCLERVRSGLTPYSGMKKDLAKLAKAAGLKPADEEASMAAELLREPSIERANDKFWKDYKAAIPKAAKQDETLQAYLLGLSPWELTADDWIDILRASGAIDLVKQGEHPDFVERIMKKATSAWSRSADKVVPLFEEILPHAGCTAISLRWGSFDDVPAEAWEQLLDRDVAIDFKIAFPETYIDLKSWASRENRAPLPHLAVSDQLRKYMFKGIEHAFEHPDEIAVIATDPHLHPLVVEFLTTQVESLESAPPTADRLITVTDVVRNFEFVDDTEIQALLDRVRTYHGNLAEVLAETLRRGLLDEIGWPEFEVAYSDKLENDPRNWTTVIDCWPGVLVHNMSEIELVVGNSRTEIQNWTGEMIQRVVEADGQIAIVTRSRSARRISWSGSRDPMEDDPHSVASHTSLYASVPVPGGRLFGENTVVRPGQPTWAYHTAQLFVEGDRAWMVTNAEEIVEIDPDTGVLGRESLPDWFEEQCRRHPDLVFDPLSSQLRPVCDETAHSPFSTADGYHRHAVFHREDDPNFALIVDADGTEFTVTGKLARSAFGVIRLPDGQPRIIVSSAQGTWTIDPSDGMRTQFYGLEFDSKMWWHHTRYRDPELSARLRKITADDLSHVIKHFTEPHVDDEVADTVGRLLDIDEYAVNRAIARYAISLAQSWPGWETSGPEEALSTTLSLKDHEDILLSTMQYEWDDIDGLPIWYGTAKLGLHDKELPQPSSQWHNGPNNWIELLGCADALLALAVIPGRTAEQAQALKELWVLLRDTNALKADHLIVENVKVPHNLQPQQFPQQSLLAGLEYHWRRPLVRADGGGPNTFDGSPVEVYSKREIAPSRTDLEPVFDALIERLRTTGPQPWSPEPGKAFAAASGALLTDAHLIMAGFPNFHKWGSNFMPKELRTAMGLKVAEAKEAKRRISHANGHFLRVLAAGIPDDAESVVDKGLDTHAMAAYWSEHGPAAPPQLPEELANRKPKYLDENITLKVFAGEHDDDGWWSEEVASLLWLANEFDLSDPHRQTLADYAEKLIQSPSSLDNIALGPISNYWEVCRSLGLPVRNVKDPDDPLYQSERFALRQEAWAGSSQIIADLSNVTDADDPDLEQAIYWGAMCSGSVQELAALKIMLHGGLDAYAQWLREPGEGDPHDPLAVVPELVGEVASTLNVSENAARYYLQLLAWPDPTDANVRRWNEWKKADITKAGTELVNAGVVVEAKRSRAKRKYFLPGGWLEGYPPHLPIETWKKESFGMVKIATRSKYEPMLGATVAPLPPTKWFATCWQRSRGDDAPQFAEIETDRKNHR
ncbi:hypothetical protein [Corynebacterium sp. Marseille-P3884]|uniref:hypothetical protein n=1 Tax=Corynebacterium sp. Marseille-P3884 TaxID=2495409 RepID=UPI001B33FF47|nr:hypothetical protein [Corynebacterium sp. Marseille-P3884]MBP3948523.1 hypothetical protein [Corynebacterium sp. Marseille-P3884]